MEQCGFLIHAQVLNAQKQSLALSGWNSMDALRGISVPHSFLLWQKHIVLQVVNSCVKTILINSIFLSLDNKAAKMNQCIKYCSLCYCHSSAPVLFLPQKTKR